MGWTGGTGIMQAAIAGADDAGLDALERAALYKRLLDALEDLDWDTQDECMGEDPVFDAVLRAQHPDWYKPEEPMAPDEPGEG